MDFAEPSQQEGSNVPRQADGSGNPFGRIVRNVWALGASQVITLSASAVAALLVPRFLGDVNLGKVAFAGAFTSYFGLMTSLGTATYLSKEVARDPAIVARYALNAALMRVPLSIGAFLLGVLTINLMGVDDLTKDVIYILFIGTLLSSVYAIIFGALQGLQEMRAIAISQVVIKVVMAVGVAAVLLTGHGLLEVAAITSLSAGAGLLVVVFALIRQLEFRIQIDFGLWRTLLLGGMPFIVWQASVLTYGKMDRIMLSVMAGDAVVGWYSAAFRITSVYAFAPVIVMTAVFPALSAAAGRKDTRAFNAVARRALQAVLLVSVPMATGIFLLSGRFIDIFDYPKEFENSIPLIMILAINAPLVAADMIIGSAVIAADRQKQWAFVALAAAALNPAMNAILIPFTQSAYGNGAIGAGAATVMTEVFMMYFGLRLLPKGVFDQSSLTNALRVVGAASVMAVVVWMIRDAFILIPVAVGAGVYGVGCLAFRAIVPNDLRRFWAYFVDRQQVRIARSS